ncbi:maleylacetoacetate isomerase [uncultured Sphingomonas sp.]|uniref:maleylacetoacetate isomerase n=1 Tax=uncultured Sphingomonas sp. TaxID=158754 RepID=UPI0035CCA363
MIVLHDYWRSSASYRVRIALAMKGIDYARHAVDLTAGEQATAANRGRNPQGFVPTLEIDGLAIGQSLAIIDYLDARFPAPLMVSSDPASRARTLQRALAIAADIQPIANLRVVKRLAAMGVDPAMRDDWSRHWIGEGLAALETMGEPEGPFLGGATPDLSDVCLVPQMYNARRFQMPLDAYPRLVAADAAMAVLPAVAAAHPDRSRFSRS